MFTLSKFFSMFMVEKRDSLKIVEIPCPKNRFLVNLGSFFSTYKFFRGQGWLISVSTFKCKYFNKKVSSLAGLKKVIQFSAKLLILAIFGYLGPLSRSIFSTYRQSFEKSLVCFLGEVVLNILSNFELCIFSDLHGVG